MMKRILPLLLAAIAMAQFAFGTHVQGGNLHYTCNGNDEYDITLTLFVDVIFGQAPPDDSVYIFALEGSTGSVSNSWAFPIASNVAATSAWSSICGPTDYRKVTYTGTITLPGIVGGYDLGWARCCLPANLANISGPLDEGITFSAHVPGTDVAPCNSQPVFDPLFPIAVCAADTARVPVNFTDADGDSIVLQFATPFSGLNYNGTGVGTGSPPPIVDPIINPLGAPPYVPMSYTSANFDSTFPFGIGVYNDLDLSIGEWRFEGPFLGLYMAGFQAIEYRNGVEISRYYTYGPVETKGVASRPEAEEALEIKVATQSDAFLIEAECKTCREVEFSLKGMMGKTLNSGILKTSPGVKRSFSIPKEGLAPGIYFLQLQSKDGALTTFFLIRWRVLSSSLILSNSTMTNVGGDSGSLKVSSASNSPSCSAAAAKSYFLILGSFGKLNTLILARFGV